jgi:hypothetical protein
MGMLQNATVLIFSTEFKTMETDHQPSVQQVQEMRRKLQLTILQAISHFEGESGCHVESVELGTCRTLDGPCVVHRVECRVVL